MVDLVKGCGFIGVRDKRSQYDSWSFDWSEDRPAGHGKPPAAIRTKILNGISSAEVEAAAAPDLIAKQIAVMLALAGTQNGPAPSSHKRALHRRVLETLRERCHEPDLTPAVAATTLGLSRRYIHIFFAWPGAHLRSSCTIFACGAHSGS